MVFRRPAIRHCLPSWHRRLDAPTPKFTCCLARELRSGASSPETPSAVPLARFPTLPQQPGERATQYLHEAKPQHRPLRSPRREPRHADAAAAAGTTSASAHYRKPTAPTTSPVDRSLSRGLHNATCLESPSFEGSPRTWTSSVARVHRIELPAIAITITSLAAHDAGHRPPNLDVLIIAP